MREGSRKAITDIINTSFEKNSDRLLKSYLLSNIAVLWSLKYHHVHLAACFVAPGWRVGPDLLVRRDCISQGRTQVCEGDDIVACLFKLHPPLAVLTHLRRTIQPPSQPPQPAFRPRLALTRALALATGWQQPPHTAPPAPHCWMRIHSCSFGLHPRASFVLWSGAVRCPVCVCVCVCLACVQGVDGVIKCVAIKKAGGLEQLKEAIAAGEVIVPPHLVAVYPSEPYQCRFIFTLVIFFVSLRVEFCLVILFR